jgi:short subunit dehydrogenase-like uncharacterized protein
MAYHQSNSIMKEFQLIIFGATGLTGSQTVLYVNKFARENGISWAIAGRNKQKLQQLVDELQLDVDGVVVADALDEKSVQAMVKRTTALINLAGPYAIYGANVIGQCAKQGVAYADLSGETLFVKKMIEKYGDTAKRTGARIIPVCGYEALPFDLGCLFVADNFQQQYDQAPTLIEAVAQFHFDGKVIYPSDGISGGTWGSAVEMFKTDNLDGVSDPHILLDNDRSWLPKESQKYQLLKNAFPHGGGWLAPMVPQPWLNPAVIYRTQEILRAASDDIGFTYREGMDTSGFFPGDKLLKPFMSVGMAMMLEAGDFLLKFNTAAPRKMVGKVMALVGPKPGDGPKPERLDLWSYTIEFTASDEAGNTSLATVTGQGQPGYKSTADIIGQVGILLAKNDKRLPKRAGVLTPASALGLDLLDEFSSARLYFSKER